MRGLFKKRQEVKLSLCELCGDGFLAVVGESHYQDALRATVAVCSGEFEGRPSFTAALVAVPENPYDGNAIAVWSPSGKLAHLGRDDARAYRRLFAEIRRLGFDGGACGAHLTGGEGGKSFGVVLRIADPERCLEELMRGEA
jgi:hypothetical protein